MRCLFIIDNLGSGGAQRQMVNLARGFKARGHHAEFFTYYPDNYFRPLLDEVGIPVHLHNKPSRFSIAPLVALRTVIRQRPFDVLLSFLDTPNFYAEVARVGLNEAVLVVSERFMYPPGKLPLAMRLLQECHRLADAIIVNSHHQRLRMIREFHWMTGKIQTIYNGVDLETFSAADAVDRSANNVSLLAISSASRKKNAVNLAKALVICRDKYHLDVRVDWIGRQENSDEGTLSAQQTRDYLHAEGLSDRWRWLGERTDIPRMLAGHDALIHPSFFEGLPNVVCEALACGRPVLASRVCDHPLLVQEGRSGYLFDPHSPDDIARSIAAFSRLAAGDRASMGKAARDYAERNLSLDRCLDEYERLLLGLVEKSQGSRHGSAQSPSGGSVPI